MAVQYRGWGTRMRRKPVNLPAEKRVAGHGLELWNFYNIAGCGGADIMRLFAAHATGERRSGLRVRER